MSRTPGRVGRTYTAARRHPTVFGRIGEWQLPFGPYTPLQLSVAFLGAFVLIKTSDWWAAVLGPLPVVGWAVAVWAARGARIAGRDPLAAVLGWVSLLVRPRTGKIGGRPARPPKCHSLHGGFVIEAAPGTPAPAGKARSRPVPTARARTRPPRPIPRKTRTVVSSPVSPSPSPSSSSSLQPAAPGPLSPLQQLLATSASTSRSSS